MDINQNVENLQKQAYDYKVIQENYRRKVYLCIQAKVQQ